MRVAELSCSEFRTRLSTAGLRIKLGPFNVNIRSNLLSLTKQLYSLYSEHLLADNEIAEVHVSVVRAIALKTPFTPHVRFLLDGRSPYPLFPAYQALAALEWGINLGIAIRTNHLLLLHSAVVEKNGHALLFPAWPGSGKTTLCSALVHKGYRLFSDEFGLVDPDSGECIPIPRLMPLKNTSIEVIRNYLPKAQMGTSIANTQKGTVAHVVPPCDSIANANIRAHAKWIIFPKWVSGSSVEISPISESTAFLNLASNSFNYEVLGQTGFDTVTRLIRECRCFTLTYSDLNDVIDALDRLVEAQ